MKGVRDCGSEHADPAPGAGANLSDPEAITDLADAPRNLEEQIQRVAEQFAEHDQAPVSNYLATVNGRRALVVPYEPGVNAGSIVFAMSDSVVVRVVSELDRSILLEIAESIT